MYIDTSNFISMDDFKKLCRTNYSSEVNFKSAKFTINFFFHLFKYLPMKISFTS